MSNVGSDMGAVLPGVGAIADAPTAIPAVAEDPQFALLRRCQRGDENAFDELVRCFHPRVFSIIRGVLRKSNDVEDVAQQVFLKVYFALQKFNFQSTVGTWIYKITVNECYDHMRRRRVRPVAALADLTAEESARVENLDVAGRAGAAGLEAQIGSRELAGKLLRRLGAEERVLLVLKEIEGYSVREVAEILDLNENTVKVRLFRARQTLLNDVKRRRV